MLNKKSAKIITYSIIIINILLIIYNLWTNFKETVSSEIIFYALNISLTFILYIYISSIMDDNKKYKEIFIEQLKSQSNNLYQLIEYCKVKDSIDKEFNMLFRKTNNKLKVIEDMNKNQFKYDLKEFSALCEKIKLDASDGVFINEKQSLLSDMNNNLDIILLEIDKIIIKLYS